MGLMTRVLLICVFMGGTRSGRCWNANGDSEIFKHEVHIGKVTAQTLITVWTFAAFVGCVVVFMKKREESGAKVVVGVVVYQEKMLWRPHSPMGCGNVGLVIGKVMLDRECSFVDEKSKGARRSGRSGRIAGDQSGCEEGVVS